MILIYFVRLIYITPKFIDRETQKVQISNLFAKHIYNTFTKSV